MCGVCSIPVKPDNVYWATNTSQYPISLDMTPDIATEYCALVHIKTPAVGMTPRDRDGSFTHTHGVMHRLPTGVKKVHCGMAWFLKKLCFLFPMYQRVNR